MQDRARDYIIHCLTNEPVLAIFNPKLPTKLHTDASAPGLGAILLQEHPNKRKRVVGYLVSPLKVLKLNITVANWTL